MKLTVTHERTRAQRGLTLVEVAFATFIVGIGLVAAMSAIGTAAVTKEVNKADPAIAFVLANEIQSLAIELPRVPWDGNVASSAAGVLTIQNLGGATFKPPINARRSSRGDLSGWSQSVQLRKVSLDDPSVVAGVVDGEAFLWELTVTIREDAVVRGAYNWWIHP